MNKSNSSILVAIITMILAAAASVILFINTEVQNALPALSIAFIAVGLLIVALQGKKPIYTMVPFILSYVLVDILLVAFGASTSSQALSILVLALYVVGMVFALSSNQKWGKIVTIVILALMLVSLVTVTYQVFDTCVTANKTLKDAEAAFAEYGSSMYEAAVKNALSGFRVGLANVFLALTGVGIITSQLVYFASNLAPKAPKAVAIAPAAEQTNVQTAEEEKADEAVAE